jgi:hypothetical protein
VEADSTRSPHAAGYETSSVTKPPNWHGLVALDMLFNNLTTGLFLVAAIGHLTSPAVFAAPARVAYLIALVLLWMDLALLVLDLGDMSRFHHMLRVFKPGSPMSFGTWCLTVYSLPLTLLAGLSIPPISSYTPEFVRLLLAAAGLAPAFGSAVYKGVLFSTSSQPGWKEARWMGGYVANSALLLGCSEFLALCAVIGWENAASKLRPTLAVLVLVNACLLLMFVRDIWATLQRTYKRGNLLRLGGVTFGVGLLAPLCLLLVAGPLTALGTFILLTAGAHIVRTEIVKLPHLVPNLPRD